jgi:hypothetical protein
VRAFVWPLLVGVVAVGVLDIIDAFVVAGLQGVSPGRVLQAIASGLLGRDAYRGGMPTAALGLALHFLIAAGVVLTYFAASGRWPALARRPWVYGPAYGVLVYLVMALVVVPLSRAQLGPRTVAGIVNGVLIHVLGVGLPAALAVRAARWRRVSSPHTHNLTGTGGPMNTPAVHDHWNAAAWWGGLVGGGTGWMVLVAGEIGLRTGQLWAVGATVLAAASLAGLGGLLWRVRAGVPPAFGGLVFVLSLYPAAVATFGLRELAGLSDYPVRRIWVLLLLVVLIPGFQLALRARRPA